jgi:hypothetical protein
MIRIMFFLISIGGVLLLYIISMCKLDGCPVAQLLMTLFGLPILMVWVLTLWYRREGM